MQPSARLAPKASPDIKRKRVAVTRGAAHKHRPPSTASAAPVTNAASSEASHRQALATSAGVARRPTGIEAMTFARASGVSSIKDWPSSGVSPATGQTQLTRMFSLLAATDRSRVTKFALASAPINRDRVDGLIQVRADKLIWRCGPFSPKHRDHAPHRNRDIRLIQLPREAPHAQGGNPIDQIGKMVIEGEIKFESVHELPAVGAGGSLELDRRSDPSPASERARARPIDRHLKVS